MHIVEKSMWGVSAWCECRIAPQLLWSSWDLMCVNDLQAEYTVCISLPVLRAERHTLPDLCQNCCQAWHFEPGPHQTVRKTAKAEVVQELQDNPEVQQGLVHLQGLMQTG